MRVYTFDPEALQPLEIGAWLMSLLAWPNPDDAEAQWNAAEALFARSIAEMVAMDPEVGATWAEAYPELAAMAPREIKRRLRTLPRRLRDRMIASRMALGFLEEGITGRAARLPPGMARLSLNELAKLVQAQARLSDPEMVERRMWRESRNVIGLAAAFQIYGRVIDPGIPGFGYPLHDGELHAKVIKLATLHEEIILEDKRFGVDPAQLVRLRQPEQRRRA